MSDINRAYAICALKTAVICGPWPIVVALKLRVYRAYHTVRILKIQYLFESAEPHIPTTTSPAMELPETLALKVIGFEIVIVLYPSVITAAALILLRRLTRFWIPTWAVVCLAVLSLPAVHSLDIWRRDRQIARKAARMGAVLPPREQGRWPGGIDLLMVLTRAFETGFLSECLPRAVPVYAYPSLILGDLLWEKMHTIGQTFEIYIFWDRNYVTSDANVVKVTNATRKLRSSYF